MRTREEINPDVWTRRDTRRLLADRDIAGVFRLLQRYGLSQRALAARTGQSQSEVSEIIAGRRQVVSYDLLLRIAEGLEVPRGWMGLAFDVDTGSFDELAVLEYRAGTDQRDEMGCVDGPPPGLC